MAESQREHYNSLALQRYDLPSRPSAMTRKTVINASTVKSGTNAFRQSPGWAVSQNDQKAEADRIAVK
jgi:hypothetical protein